MSLQFFPKLEEVLQIYNQKYRPTFQSQPFEDSQSGVNEMSDLNEAIKTDEDTETNDSLADGTDEKVATRGYHEGFEDFSYDSNDFECQLDPSMENKSGDNSFQHKESNRGRGRQKERKIRTTITMDRLQEMNKIFKEYQEEKDKGRNPPISLKEIGNKLQLGYSTILHKFRQFRENKCVKGGALLESLQKKRKYGKSKNVEKYIERSLRERPFYTAVQLSKYIFRRFQQFYSRSIISRHLTEMGYSFNNIKPFPIEKNAVKYIQVRRYFAHIVESYIEDESNLIFIDEVAFSKNLFARYFTNFIASAQEKKSNEKQTDYVSLIVGANNQKIHFYEIRDGFFGRHDFCNAVRKTSLALDHDKRYTIGQTKEYILFTDTHRIHYDEEETISDCLKGAKMKRFFLPPGSPQLNPLESLFSTIRERLSKEGITDRDSLRHKLQYLMQGISKESTSVYFKELKMWINKAKMGENF